MNYVSVADIRNFKVAGATAELDNYTDSEVEAAIKLAESIIESVTGDIFYSKEVTHRFNGSGIPKLFFIPTVPYPIISVASVKDIDPNGVVRATFSEGQDFVVCDYYLALVSGTGTVRQSLFKGGIWRKGEKNIEVAGTWGRAETPEEIKHCTKLLAVEQLSPGFANLTTTDVVQSVWSDFTVSFRSTDKIGKNTGFIEIDRILNRHVNYSSLFLNASGESNLGMWP